MWVEPARLNGAQMELQQPVQPLQTVPSMEQLVAMAEQVPAVVPLAPVQTAVQQSLSLKQMSPTCVQ